MKVLLMHPDRDWDQEPALSERFRWSRPDRTAPEWRRYQQALMQDLAFETLLGAMG
jgi:hypothetical protein